MHPRHVARLTNAASRNRLASALWTRLHAGAYRLTGGRLVGRWFGAPIVLLETVGRRTGRQRSTPVLGLRDGDATVVLAAASGSARTPAWWLNLEAAGRATLVEGRRRRDVRPRVAEGAERDRLWERYVAMYPAAAEYPAFTDREMALVILEPHGFQDPAAPGKP